MKARKKSRKISIVTLGCSKNLVDSEVLMRQLSENNIEVVHNPEVPHDGTVVINTCGFIQDAKEESINTILEYVRLKEEGRIDNLYVMGCLSERYKTDLQKEIPEVDQYFGVHDLKEIIEIVGADYKKELLGERLISTPSHYAYLKISEGCDRRCSFCAIPLIRGNQVSRSVEELVTEAGGLAAKGVKELILIAQDLTAYGTDIYGERRLSGLLDKLVGVKEISWIRLHYAYPDKFPIAVLDRMCEHDKICNYLDLPFQHISDKLLKMMHRGIDRRGTLDLVDQIRKKVPGLALRTTLLVGHPGETEEDFNLLKDFVVQSRFERLGVFVYSEEEGTFSARKFKDDVPADVKQDRLDEIMNIQQDISLELNQQRIGTELRVLVDGREGEYAVCRSEYDSPEVDNEVLVHDPDNQLHTGEFISVRITGAGEFDLFGSLQV